MTNTTALDLDRLTRWTFDRGMTAEVAPEGQWVRYTDLRAALAAKGQQEPVAYVKEYDSELNESLINIALPVGTQVFTRAAPVAQQSEAGSTTADLDKCIRAFAMLVAEEGIKAGSGSTMSVGSDKVRAVAEGVLSWITGRGLVEDIKAAARVAKPTEAGAPTAAVELGIGFSNNDQGAHASVMRKHADGTFKVLLHDRVPTGDSFFRFSLDAPTSGRESAAPGAKQDAKDAARYGFLREHWVSFSAAPPLSNLHWKGDKLDAKVDAAILGGDAHG